MFNGAANVAGGYRSELSPSIPPSGPVRALRWASRTLVRFFMLRLWVPKCRDQSHVTPSNLRGVPASTVFPATLMIVDRVRGSLGDDESSGLLSDYLHLRAMGPSEKRVRGQLGSDPGHLWVLAGAALLTERKGTPPGILLRSTTSRAICNKTGPARGYCLVAGLFGTFSCGS